MNNLAFSPDGKLLATVSGGPSALNEVKLWDVATGKPRATLSTHKLWTGILSSATSEHSMGVLSVAFSPDGKTLATGSWDYTVKLWDLATGRVRATLHQHPGDVWVMSVAFSPDGNTLATAGEDSQRGVLKLWDVATGQLLATFE